MDLTSLVGGIDIYLLDQVMRGFVPAGSRILDAGCGRGRNQTYFLRSGYELFANDRDAGVLAEARSTADSLIDTPFEDRFRVEAVEDSSFGPAQFDFIICNAVLHFARDAGHFEAMVERLREMLRPNGRVFCRLATTITLSSAAVEVLPDRAPGWGRFPDGSEYFLMDEDGLNRCEKELGLTRLEPLKTVNVQDRRCMSNWVWGRAD